MTTKAGPHNERLSHKASKDSAPTKIKPNEKIMQDGPPMAGCEAYEGQWFQHREYCCAECSEPHSYFYQCLRCSPLPKSYSKVDMQVSFWVGSAFAVMAVAIILFISVGGALFCRRWAESKAAARAAQELAESEKVAKYLSPIVEALQGLAQHQVQLEGKLIEALGSPSDDV